METLAPTPANADNTATADSGEADANLDKATGDGTAPSVPEADTPETKRDKVQERFDKLTREKYEGLSRAERAEYRAQLAEQRLATLEEQHKAKTAEVAPQTFPTLEQFGWDESKFSAAVAAYNKANAEAATNAAREAAREELRVDREKQTQEQARRNWAKKQADFIKLKPDYVEKVLEASSLPISREIQMELQESELGPQIAYYLVENPEKAAAIMALPLKEQLKEVVRIETRLEGTKTPAKPAVSQAPSPVPKIDATESPLTGISTTDPESDKLSDAEWVKRENARIRRKEKRAN